MAYFLTQQDTVNNPGSQIPSNILQGVLTNAQGKNYYTLPVILSNAPLTGAALQYPVLLRHLLLGR